jgi:hypothetical protein
MMLLVLLTSVLGTSAAATVSAPSVSAPSVPAKPPTKDLPNTEEACAGDQICINGVRTKAVKAAIRVFLEVFEDNLPRLIRVIQNAPISDVWKRPLRTNLPIVKTTLEGLLAWEDLVWLTIQNQVTNACIQMDIAPRIAGYIGMGARYILEWGLL